MTRPDPYPSRIGGEATVLPRKDPVVHGDVRREVVAGPLSIDDLCRYDEQGAFVLDAVLPREEVAALAMRAASLRVLTPSDPETVIREPGSDEVRSVFAVHESDPLFRAFVDDPRIHRIAEQVLGGPVYVHQSRINYKPAFVGEPFYWHSDFETWHVEDGMPRMRACSLSVSLSENRADNGPLMFVPGSHRHYVSCAGETPEENYKRSLRRQEIGVPPAHLLEELAREGGVESPTGPAGSAVLFDCNLMHGSNGNITPYPRTNLFVVFNAVENALEAPFSGGRPRPDFIASRSVRALG